MHVILLICRCFVILQNFLSFSFFPILNKFSCRSYSLKYEPIKMLVLWASWCCDRSIFSSLHDLDLNKQPWHWGLASLNGTQTVSSWFAFCIAEVNTDKNITQLFATVFGESQSHFEKSQIISFERIS